jgi:hypothetical protein
MQWQVCLRRHPAGQECRRHGQIAVAKRGVLAIVPPDPDRGNATSLLRTTGTGRRPEMATGRAGQSPGKRICGEVAEWSKAHAWKVCRRGTVSRVRIPLSPPFIFLNHCFQKLIFELRFSISHLFCFSQHVALPCWTTCNQPYGWHRFHLAWGEGGPSPRRAPQARRATETGPSQRWEQMT